MLLGDDVFFDEGLHAVVGGGGVDGVGLGGVEVGLGLANVLRAGAVEGFLEEGGVLVEGGVGLGDLLGTVAALEAAVVGFGLEDGGLGLVALGLELGGVEGDERSVGGDLLAFFDEDAGDAAADLGADVDLAGFDGAGVGERGGAVGEEIPEERGEEEEGCEDREDDALALHGGSRIQVDYIGGVGGGDVIRVAGRACDVAVWRSRCQRLKPLFRRKDLCPG